MTNFITLAALQCALPVQALLKFSCPDIVKLVQIQCSKGKIKVVNVGPAVSGRRINPLCHVQHDHKYCRIFVKICYSDIIK
jgi:hypothetical protein